MRQDSALSMLNRNAIKTLRFQHGKETFHWRIVPTVRLTRHALNYGMFRKQLLISERTVKHALVGMKNRFFAGQSVSGFGQYFLHYFSVGCVCAGSGIRLGI